MRIRDLIRWRSPSTPRGLRRAIQTLGELSKPRKDDYLDVAAVRQELTVLVERLVIDHSDDEIFHAIDTYVDGHVAEFRRTMFERHSAQLSSLDRLEIAVGPYLARTGTLSHDELSRLSHLDAAVIHALDLLSDPETPIFDPRIPEPRREGLT